MSKGEVLQEIEQGPLRPPSEAESMLVRVVRNCPWNRCSFCPAYKREKFSLRNVRDVLADIEKMAAEPYSDSVKTIFLQDGDALIMPIENLEEIIRFISKSFSALERLTAYSRSNTLANKKVKDLKRLKKAGLTRIHVGVESGSGEVLKFVNKGTTAAKQLKGCQHVKEAGLELCCYVMPGLGGRRFTRQHAKDTGRLIAEIEPDHIRLRTTFVLEDTPLAEEYAKGFFEPLSEEETVKEIRAFLTELSNTKTELISDHRINLLFELEGVISDDFDRLMSIIDRFLELDAEEKTLFIAGRRLRLIKRLDDLKDNNKRERVINEKHRYEPIIPMPRSILY